MRGETAAEHADVAVLGAGPAGLGAAYRLADAGHRVVVLERGDQVGGLAGSFEIGGVRVDHGSHRLHPSIPAPILAHLRRLLGSDLQRRPRRGRIRLAGRWVAFPLQLGNLLRQVPWTFAAGVARDGLLAPLRRPARDTFAEVLRAGVGPTLSERFYFPYARKIWGLEPDQLSGAQARRRVATNSVAKIATRIVRGQREPAWFWYPRTGFGAISEALAEGARAAGAHLWLACTVTGVERSDHGMLVRTHDGRTVSAEHVWSTLPVTALVRMLQPPPDHGVVEAASALEYRAMLLVYVVLNQDRYTPFDAHYLPEGFTPVTRLSEPKNYRDGDDPDGVTVLCAELPCAPDDPWWSMSEGELGEVVAEACRRAELPPLRPAATVVRRQRFAYPLARVGAERRFAPLDGWIAAQPRLLTLGRQGLFAHDNTHHALIMAWDAADALNHERSFDDAKWSAARARFTDHVVED